MTWEIRENVEFGCVGVNLISPIIDEDIPKPEDVTVDVIQEKPLQQIKEGVSPGNVECNPGFSLLVKADKSSVACVKSSSIQKLLDRNWIFVFPDDPSKLVIPFEVLEVVKRIPRDDERALKYVVWASGSEIQGKPLFSTTVSKFAPFSNPEETILGIHPDNPFEKGAHFYLESLPSKDKDLYYEFISDYVNRKKVEPFDIEIDINTQDDITLQKWIFNRCDVTNYSIFLEDKLATYMFHERFPAEIRDRALFDCDGQSFGIE